MSIDASMLDGPYDCVFDVGAHVGDFAKACLREWPGCTVDSFEPLRNLVNLGPHGPWRWHQVALSDETGEQLFWRNDFEPSSSLLTMAEAHREAFPYTRSATSIRVETACLDSYAGRIRGRALLKLDVQGAELKVLQGAFASLGVFAAVVLEMSHVELYERAPAPVTLAELLQTYGFAHKARVDVTRHPITRQVLQSDELWVRA